MSISDKLLREISILERKSGINRIIISSFYFFALVLLTFGVLEEQVFELFSFWLPTIICLKSLMVEENKDDKQWLSYWGILALITLFEVTVNSVLKLIFRCDLGLGVIPFYQLTKFIAIVILTLPSMRATCFIYDKVFLKYFQIKVKDRDLMYRKILSMRPSTTY